MYEQDEESPHRYLFQNRMPQKDCVIADIGAAEGIFALDVIQYGKKIYLFECDQEWIEALRLTFAEEIKNGKAEIVDAFIGAEDDAAKKTLTLDTFFKDKQLDYVKADIEGAEEAMLAGGEMTFTQKVQDVLLCCYHTQNAESMFKTYLYEKGFNHIEVNQKWMIWSHQLVLFKKPLEKPYLRRGVLFASKSENNSI